MSIRILQVNHVDVDARLYLSIVVINEIRLNDVTVRTRDFVCVIQLTLVVLAADWSIVI